MKSKHSLSVLFLAIAALILSGNPAWSQSQGGKDTSVGGDLRDSDSQTPLPPDPGNVEKSGSSPRPRGTAQSGKDTSVGGTQSQRTGGDSQTPLPSVARPGTDDAVKDRNRSAGHRGMSGMHDVREAQEALKNQGHDPGPIDGIMGSQTRQALREFQSQNGLKQTGTLDAQTKEKLNIDNSSFAPSPSSPSRSDSMRQKQSR
jgi:peptidoglycan hydrolase-like protein with peptidoglycan-binding domain